MNTGPGAQAQESLSLRAHVDPWDSSELRPSPLEEQGCSPSAPESDTQGKKGEDSGHHDAEDRSPWCFHYRARVLPSPGPVLPGKPREHLPPESLKPPLSLPLAVGTQKLPLYQALGKWEETRRIAPGSGGWTAGLISGWLSPPTLRPCTLLGCQGPASCLDIDDQTP